MSLDPHDPVAALPPRARPHAARLLIAIPYRQAGLIAACALAGAAAMLAALAPLSRATHATNVAGAQAHGARVTPVGDAVRLRLELDPDAVAAQDDASAPVLAQAPSAAAALRLDEARAVDAIDDALRAAAPAAGPARLVAAAHVGAPSTLAWRGLAAGLLAGLLMASLRELRGGRMRTPREAEWALGAPVLAAIPTLSAKALAATFGAMKPA